MLSFLYNYLKLVDSPQANAAKPDFHMLGQIEQIKERLSKWGQNKEFSGSFLIVGAGTETLDMFYVSPSPDEMEEGFLEAKNYFKKIDAEFVILSERLNSLRFVGCDTKEEAKKIDGMLEKEIMTVIKEVPERHKSNNELVVEVDIMNEAIEGLQKKLPKIKIEKFKGVVFLARSAKHEVEFMFLIEEKGKLCCENDDFNYQDAPRFVELKKYFNRHFDLGSTRLENPLELVGESIHALADTFEEAEGLVCAYMRKAKENKKEIFSRWQEAEYMRKKLTERELLESLDRQKEAVH